MKNDFVVKILFLSLIAISLLLLPITMRLTGYFVSVSGSGMNLTMWYQGDEKGGFISSYKSLPVNFYTNLTNSSSGEPINGSGTYCEISFNISSTYIGPINMSFNTASKLYEYEISFLTAGNHTWNVTCDATSLGYGTLSGEDNMTIKELPEWWDVNWHYRVGLEINNTGYERKNWPVEYEINFTKVLQDINVSGTFDENSTRVIEYNSTGSVLHELPSQFDKGGDYDPTTNAVGTLVFEMNGTTQADEIRYFYIYFDMTENGNKNEANYSTNLSYNYTGNVSEFNVNNSLFRWWVDTERGENTSGIYHVIDQGTENEILRVDPSDNKTVEYSKFSNATDTFGFDLRDNATFKHVGPVRIVIEQKGEEIFWNQPDNKTNEGYLIKRYTFYRDIDWMKIEQIFVNNASYNITRNSTVAGALALDVNYSMDLPGGVDNYPNMSNPNDPGSYGWVAREDGQTFVGIVNIYENGTNKFFGLEDSSIRRIGIQLNETNITVGNSIKHVAYLQFNGSGEAGQENYFLAFV
ncbi:MAG: hypothetical protein KAW40_01325, partial [Candidatus Aenigmarchaeota archaeon]|nr:hypothetical protein [Candidatus Aenigmarchaeota archaeon]